MSAAILPSHAGTPHCIIAIQIKPPSVSLKKDLLHYFFTAMSMP
jgi:hypothetical protein